AKGFLVVFASGKDRRTEGGELHTNFSLKKSGEYLALVKPLGTVEHHYSPSYPGQATDVSYGLAQNGATTTIVSQGSLGRAGVAASQGDFNANYNGWNTSINGSFTGSTWRNVFLGVGYERNSGYGNWIGGSGDFESQMYNTNSSIFLRSIFTLTDPNEVSGLILRMRYDAGFVAYINGVEVASSREPSTLSWNSSATEDRPDSQNEDWESFSINLTGVTLNAGNNLLAIHGLNDRVGSSDMLCLPELDMIGNPSSTTTSVYFLSPSPGGVNSGGSTDLPPLVDDVTDSVSPLRPGGGGSAPIAVTARVTETNHPISSVRLYYRAMYNSESQLTMKDDGIAPDVTAGDGIYTVNLPTNTLNAGQMLRWRVEVRDDQNNLSKSPPYEDADDSDEYFGTIADPGITTSQLPILHWFVSNPSSANTRGGTRSSFFYLGEFYDNIQTDLHGQTTSGFGKKSYDIDFNKGNRFKWKEGEIKAKDINLLTNWADKTKMRNTMAYEVFRDAGAAHHYAFPVRVQQNAAFFSIADMVEDGDDRFLERIGFDPEGALY
ncbi:MAG: CotH kinase family protein, partial [Akkermansiaceae bacterium]